MTSEDEKTVHQQSITTVDIDDLAEEIERDEEATVAERALVAAVRGLRDTLITRDMQLSTTQELLSQAQAKSDELRGRWDRAETAREELREKYDLEQKTAFVLAQKLTAMGDELAVWQAHAQRGETDLANARNERDGLALAIVTQKDELGRLRDERERVLSHAGERNYCDSCGKHILNIVTAHAKLARVEALPAKWRAKGRAPLQYPQALKAYDDCATDIEAALKD